MGVAGAVRPSVKEGQNASWGAEKARLLRLLRDTEGELEARAEELADCQAQLADILIDHVDKGNPQAAVEGLAIDLKDRLRFSHSLARKLRHERTASVMDYTAAVQRAEAAVSAASELEAVVARQEEEMECLRERLSSAESAEAAAAAGWSAAEARVAKQGQLYQQRAHLQDQRGAALQDALHRQRAATAQAELEAESLRAVCDQQRKVIGELERSVAAARDDAAALEAAGAEWRRQQMSVDQVWADNTRLAALLQHGPHYQQLVQDLEDSDGCVYLPAAPDKSGDLQALLHQYGHAPDHVPVLPRHESANWVPAEAFDIVTSFCATHLPSLPLPDMRALLVGVNAVWRQQEQRKLARARAAHAKNVADLRRQLQNKRTYEDVVGACRTRHTMGTAGSSRDSDTRQGDQL